MKVRNGFVSNSSSTSFMIRNRTKEKKTLVDFVEENPHLIQQYFDMYCSPSYPEDANTYTQENLVASAKQNNIRWKPNEVKECIFGDEQGTLVGHVFDYILRSGGKSKSFSWHFHEWHR